MLQATSLDVKVTLSTHPVTGKLTFKIGDDLANPSLTVYKGFLYRFNVQTNSTHPFVIKHTSGDLNLGQYNNGVTDNGSYNKTIEWLVKEDTPNFLIYQSPNNLEMTGLITVKSFASYLPNSMKLIDESKLNEISLSDLVNKFNHNSSLALTTNDGLAGRGLTFRNRRLEIDSYGQARFFLDNNGNLISADSKIRLTDNQNNINSYTNPDTLIDSLNAIASAIRKLKDPAKPFYQTSPYTLKDIADIAKGVEDYTQNVESTIVDLQRRYEELLLDYEELLEYFKNHTHDASDIKTGIIDPRRLGQGLPSNSTYLRGDSNWAAI